MGTLWRYLCIVAIAVVSIPTGGLGCEATSLKFGNITKDYDLLVGSKLTVRCTLFTNEIQTNNSMHSVSSKDMILKFGNTVLQNVDILDNNTIEYTIPSATINDTGAYFCYLNNPKLTLICSTIVSVGYPPLPVENFQCIGLGYQKLNCSWGIPFNPVKTNYTLYDFVSIYKRSCPIVKSDSCEFRLNSKPPYRKSTKYIRMSLVGENSLGRETTDFTLNHFEIVRPAAPREMTFSNITKNSVRVQWLLPKGMEYDDFPPGLTYSIQYCPEQVSDPSFCKVIEQQNATSMSVSDLLPYMEYNFMVHCRSNVAVREDMWSPFLTSSVQTEADVPYLAPDTMFSAFQSQNTQSNRTITLYWKPVPWYHQNGDDFQYIIQYHLHFKAHSRQRRAFTEWEVGNRTSYSFHHMDPNSTYLFRISAKNHVGQAAKFSVITIDKAQNLLPRPTDISVLSYGEGKYSVSWNSPSSSTENYTLFWCPSTKLWSFKCDGPLEWMTVTQTNQSLNLSDSQANYQFAVAANSHSMTSGLQWAPCVVPFHGVLNKVAGINLVAENSTSIKVRWRLDCEAQRIVVQEYAITYCQLFAKHSCLGPVYKVNLTKPTSEEYVVGGLEPFTLYMFSVASRTADGWSEDSTMHYQSTLSSAPSDPPREVALVRVEEKTVRITFRSPTKPNGKITQYSVFYTMASTRKEHRLDYPVNKTAEIYEAELHLPLFYTNYSIEVKACVKSDCSPSSTPVYALTGMSAPGALDSPHAEVLNSSLVNVTWKQPNMPNGPIDLYQLTVESESDEMEGRKDVFNVSGALTYFTLPIDCPQQVEDGEVYYFRVQAINIKHGQYLYGPRSEMTQTRLCFIPSSGLSYSVLAGVIVGVSFGLTVMVIVIYALAKWMKKKVDMVKDIHVQLPTGLDSPLENPLNTYDKFKSGLQKNRDSGIPSERTYERLCSYASDKMTKDLENSFDASSEEFLNSKKGREKTGRNQSGDSNTSGKGHDSISSSNTNKTHLSIDSGAEMDLPPSPDGLFSDTSSSNTTPRSYKPDLEIVEENNPSSSKDSGLEKESMERSPPIVSTKPATRFPYYIRKKGHPYFNPQFLKQSGQMQPYSKFAIVTPVFTPNYVSVGSSAHLLEQQSLANSEPSVAEFPEDSDCEPLMMSGVPPYCRFGLARSAGNGLNITNQSLSVQENLGYSKFGIIYSAIINPKAAQNPMVLPNYSKVTCPRFIPNFTDKFSFLPQMKLPSRAIEEKLTNSKECAQIKIVKAADKSSGPSTPVKKAGTSSGYVSFNQALSDASNPLAASPQSGTNSLIQSTTVATAAVLRNDGILVNPGSHSDVPLHTQGKPKSYISFQDAKVMMPPVSSSDNLDILPSLPEEDAILQPGAEVINCNGELSVDLDDLETNSLLSPVSLELPIEKTEEDIVPTTTHCNGEVYSLHNGLEEPNPIHDVPLLVSERTLDDDLHPKDLTVSPSSKKLDVVPAVSKPKHETITYSIDKASLGSSSKAQPTSSNGYVTWTELLGSNPADVTTLPNGTKNSLVQHV